MISYRAFLVQFFLVIIILFSFHISWTAENKATNTTLPKKNTTIIQETPSSQKEQLTQRDMARESQSTLDRSISILNIVATLMGVLVGLVTLVVVIGAALGLFEYRRLKEIRQEMEGYKRDAQKSAEKVKELLGEVTPIADYMRKIKAEAERLIGQLRDVSLAEKPTEEIKRKIEELDDKSKVIEEVGMELSAEGYFIRGVNFYYKGNYELALEAFEKSIELNPDAATAWGNKSATLNKLRRYKEALEAAEKSLELQPDYTEAWVSKSAALGALGRHEEALIAAEKAIELKPDNAAAWGNKSAALIFLSRYEEALVGAEKAIELKPDNAEAWISKSYSLTKLSRYEEALVAAEKAIELKPENGVAWGNRGFALDRLGRHEEALEAIEKAIKLKPDNVEVWANKSATLDTLGRYEEALVAAEKAIELKPDYAEAWVNKSYSLIKLGRYEEALEAIEKAIKLKPDSAEAWYNRACVYALKGKKKKALSDLERAIKLDRSCKEKAIKDEDFKALWDDGDFKKLTV